MILIFLQPKKSNSVNHVFMENSTKLHSLVKSQSGKAKEPLDLVHSDVCGKVNCKSLSGAEYFLTFINNKTRYTWVYVLKRKSDVFTKFREWKVQLERLTGRKLKIFRTDNGGEFTSGDFEYQTAPNRMEWRND